MYIFLSYHLGGPYVAGEAEDVELRGTLCAMRALDALKAHGVVARAGVASGPAFCGPVYGVGGIVASYLLTLHIMYSVLAKLKVSFIRCTYLYCIL